MSQSYAGPEPCPRHSLVHQYIQSQLSCRLSRPHSILSKHTLVQLTFTMSYLQVMPFDLPILPVFHSIHFASFTIVILAFISRLFLRSPKVGRALPTPGGEKEVKSLFTNAPVLIWGQGYLGQDQFGLLKQQISTRPSRLGLRNLVICMRSSYSVKRSSSSPILASLKRSWQRKPRLCRIGQLWLLCKVLRTLADICHFSATMVEYS